MFALAPLAVPFCILWASAFVAAKVGVTSSPPLLFLTARFLLAGVILTGIAWQRGALKGISWRDMGWLVVLGAFNNALYLGCNFTAMVKISAGLSSIISSCLPVVTASLAPLVLREKLRAKVVLGLVLGIVGVTIVVHQRIGVGVDNDPVPLILTIVALLSISLGTLLYKRLHLSVPLLASGGVQVLAGGLLLLPVALMTEPVSAIHLTAGYWEALAFLVGPVSIGAFLLWFTMLQRTTAAAASVWHFAIPPLGVLFGWALLREPMAASDLLGIVPVALAIYLVTQPAPE